MKTLWLCATFAAIELLCGRPAAAQARIVSVTGGRVEGVSADGVTSFKGVPFAAPPVGTLRWRAPQPVRPWRGIRQADRFAPGCMQAPNVVPMFGMPPVLSEDCLYLNVWTPAKSSDERHPVMVWIYGGSFLVGTTSQPVYDGTHLARKGVVLVSLAYRVGVFGFLADPELSGESSRHVSGNYGLLDMIAGLKWVKRNIAKFGGDPTRVTIFGESAGGVAVGMLAQSPLAKGLFQRAIGESGTGLTPPRAGRSGDLRHAEAAGRRFLANLGAENIEQARALDAQVLQRALGPAAPTSKVDFRPVRDDYVLRGDGYQLYQARRFNDTPVLIGSNSDEGSLFAPAHTSPSQFEDQIRAAFGAHAKEILAAYPHATDSESSQAAIDLFRDTQMAWPAWTWAKLQAEKGEGKAYLYYFDAHAPQYPPQGSPHGAEIGYVFDNLGMLIHSGAALTWPAPADDPSLAATISEYWVNFARTGDPNGPGLPVWPAFTASSQRVMYLDAHPHAGPVPNLRQIKALDAYFAWRREEAKKRKRVH